MHLEPDFFVSLREKVFKGFVKDDRQLAILALFLTEGTDVSGFPEVMNKHIDSYFLFELFHSLIEVLDNLATSLTFLFLFSFLRLSHLAACLGTLGLDGLSDLGKILLLHLSCFCYNLRFVEEESLNDFKPESSKSDLNIVDRQDVGVPIRRFHLEA